MTTGSIQSRRFAFDESGIEEAPDWPSIAVLLLGAQTRFVHGTRWTHRIIEYGSGDEVLLLLHGVGGHAEVYARNMASLSRLGFRVVAADALYHGLSDKEPYDDARRYDLQVEAVLDLLDALGVERAHIEGESMGATIAFHFGMRYPNRCGRIILNTGFGHVDLQRNDFRPPTRDMRALVDLSWKVLESPTPETMRKRLEWVVADPQSVTQEMVDLRLRLYADPEVNASMQRVFRVGKTWQWDLPYTEEDCRQFEPTTLVLWTTENPGHGPDYGEYVSSLLRDGYFYCMEGAAHWPQWERPEVHDALVAAFLRAGA